MISFPFSDPFSIIQESIRKPLEKTVNSKHQPSRSLGFKSELEHSLTV